MHKPGNYGGYHEHHTDPIVRGVREVATTFTGAYDAMKSAMNKLTGGDANAKGGDFQRAWEQGVQKPSLGEKLFKALKAPDDKVNDFNRSRELLEIAHKDPKVASAVMSVEANIKDLNELRAVRADWQARRDDPTNVKDRKQLDKGIKSLDARIAEKRAEIEAAKDVIAKSNIPAAKNRVGALTTANEGRNPGSQWEEKAQSNFVSDAKATAKLDQSKADLYKITEKNLESKIQSLKEGLSAPKDSPSAPNKGGDVYLSAAERVGSKLGAIKDKILGAGLPHDVGQNHQAMIQKAQETSARKAELAHAQQVLKDKQDTAAAVKTSREATDTIKEASADKARLTKEMASASPEQKESMQKQIDKLDEKIKTAQDERSKALGTIKTAHDRKDATMEKAAQSKAAVEKLEKTGDNVQYHKDMDKPTNLKGAVKEAASNERKAAFEAGLYSKSPEELSALKDKMDKAAEGRTLSPEAEKRRETVSNVLDNQKQAAENKVALKAAKAELAEVQKEVKNFEPLFTVNAADAKKQDDHIKGLEQKKEQLIGKVERLEKSTDADKQKHTDTVDRHVHAKDHQAQVEKYAGVDKGAEKVSLMEAQLKTLEQENTRVSQEIKNVKSGGLDSKIEALSQKLEAAIAENAKLKDELAEAKRQQGGGVAKDEASPKAEAESSASKGGVVSGIVKGIDNALKAAGDESTRTFVENLTGVKPAPAAPANTRPVNSVGERPKSAKPQRQSQSDRGEGADLSAKHDQTRHQGHGR